MKSNKVIHHTGRDANVFSDVETEIENLRTYRATLRAITLGQVFWSASRSTPSGSLLCDGSAVSRATYADLYGVLMATATVTISIASPGVVSWTAHGRTVRDPVKFTTTGALPTGLTASTTYYVIPVDADTFRLASSAANATAGTAINTSGSQSGTHTGIYAPFGDGDGSTTFNLPDFSKGAFVRGYDSASTNDVSRSFGSTQTDAFASHTHTTGQTGTGLNGSIAATGATVGVVGSGAVVTGSAGGATETRPRNIALNAFIIY